MSDAPESAESAVRKAAPPAATPAPGSADPTAPTAPWTMGGGSAGLLLGLEARAVRLAERVAQGPWWAWRCTALALVILLISSFPSIDKMQEAEFAKGWADIQQRIDQPTVQPANHPGSHAAQLTYRLTVPLLSRLLGGGMWGCLALQFATGIGLLYLVARLTERHSGDRVLACWMAILVASLHAGAEPWVDLRGSFDGFALFFLAWAMLSRRPWWIATCVFMAAGTDERGLICSSLVWLYHAHLAAPERDLGLRAFVRPATLGVMAGWALYFAVRLGMAHAYGLTTPTGGTGVRILLNQINLLPAGLWTGLEGGWLLVALAAAALWRLGHWRTATLYVLGLALVSVVAFAVTDITRSLVYLLPGLVLALAVLGPREPRPTLRHVGAVALLLSLLWPMYIVFGKHDIWWHYPLPVQLARWFLLGG